MAHSDRLTRTDIAPPGHRRGAEPRRQGERVGEVVEGMHWGLPVARGGKPPPLRCQARPAVAQQNDNIVAANAAAQAAAGVVGQGVVYPLGHDDASRRMVPTRGSSTRECRRRGLSCERGAVARQESLMIGKDRL